MTSIVNIVPAGRSQRDRFSLPHRVVAVAYDGLCTFEFGIVVEMFGLARPEFEDWYSFSICALERRPIRAVGGFTIAASGGLGLLRRADTIVIPGWRKPYQVPPPAPVSALQQAHQRGARIVSICVGSFVLAAAGLLDGKRATTHWAWIDEMARRFPAVKVQPNVLYVEDGRVLTSAGSAAGIDLCLHVIRNDFGTVVANTVARRAVVSPHREGGQAQFIEKPVGEAANPWLSTLLEWAHVRLEAPITVEGMAKQAHVSKRTLCRKFAAATGTSPLAWITGLRVRRAKDLLETTSLSIDEVAEQCGFGSAAILRHHFRARVLLSPNQYRERFRQTTTR